MGGRIATISAAMGESSDDAIISKDLNGTITSGWNDGVSDFFEFAAEEK